MEKPPKSDTGEVTAWRWRMSYTRSAWKREYTFGESKLYSFIGTDGNLWVMGSGLEDGFEVIEKEDVFEFVVSILKSAGVELKGEDMEKLAQELKVELRDEPLSWEEIMEDMEKRTKETMRKYERWVEKQKEKFGKNWREELIKRFREEDYD